MYDNDRAFSLSSNGPPKIFKPDKIFKKIKSKSNRIFLKKYICYYKKKKKNLRSESPDK